MATLILRADLDTIDTHPHVIFDYARDEEKWLAEYDRAYEKGSQHLSLLRHHFKCFVKRMVKEDSFTLSCLGPRQVAGWPGASFLAS